MSWREELSADLQPSPLPPEGSDAAQVRRDIIDELTDHLECAMRRELRRSDDEDAARRAVLKRFGDPKRIACRLWFDAMKESIMSQRISLITNIVVAVACITVCVFALLAMQRNSQLTEAMLAKVEAIGAEGQTTVASEIWAEATATVHRGTADGDTIEGFEVAISGQPFNVGESRGLSELTDASGTVSFGPVRPGEYLLQYQNQGVQFLRTVLLYPGQNEMEPIVWPVIEARPAPVSFELAIPESLQQDAAYLVCLFSRTPRGRHPTARPWQWDALKVILAPDGRAMVITEENLPFAEPIEGPTGSSIETLVADKLDFVEASMVDASFTYGLKSIGILALLTSSDAESGQYLEVRAGVPAYNGFFHSSGKVSIRVGNSSQVGPWALLKKTGQQWFDGQPVFEVTQGSDSTWRLEIPDWFADFASNEIREYKDDLQRYREHSGT